MGNAKGLMNLFFKVEDDGKDAPKASPVKEEVKPAPVQTSFNPSVPSSPVIAVNEDAEIKKQLAAALEQANQPGYDYFEMAQSIAAQASIIPSEALRFQSTFATISSMGITPDKLVDSAQFYLTVLKKKEDEFTKTVDQHMAEAVTSRENDVVKFDADMQSKSEMIKKLTEEINEMQQQKTAIINEVSSNKAQIEQVRNNFSATMKVFVDRINSDIDKIKMYLKPASK